MVKHKKFITLLAVSTLTIAALPVVPIANLATVVVSAEGATPTSAVSTQDDTVTINADLTTAYTDSTSGEAKTYHLTDADFAALKSALSTAGKTLVITGAQDNIADVIGDLKTLADVGDFEGGIISALLNVTTLGIAFVGDAEIDETLLATVGAALAVVNSGSAKDDIADINISSTGSITLTEAAATAIGKIDNKSSDYTLSAEEEIILPAGTDFSDVFGDKVKVDEETPVKIGAASAISVTGGVVTIDADKTGAYQDDDTTYHLSDAAFVALKSVLSSNKKLEITGPQAKIADVLTDLKTISNAGFGAYVVAALNQVTDFDLAFDGDATIDADFLATVSSLATILAGNEVLTDVGVSATGTLTLSEGVKTILAANSLGADVAFTAEEIVLPDGETPSTFFGSYGSVSEGQEITVDGNTYVAGDGGSLANSLSSLTIDADTVDLADPNSDLNAKLASLAEDATVTVTGGIGKVRELLTAFATLTNTGAELNNIKTLNLAIDGDTEFIPNDLAYINYLKGQITSSSLDTLNIDVTGNVTFGAKLEGSDSSIPDTIAGSVSDTIFTTFSASGTVTLPEGIAATQKAIKAFFGKAVVADGTEVKVDGKTFISDGENGYEPKPSTPSTPGGDGGSTTPPSTEDPEVPTDLPTFGGATAHIQNIGDVPSSAITLGGNSVFVGTTGRSLRLEEVSFSLADGLKGLSYQVHVQDKGWLSPVADGAKTGTRGQGKRIEAIKFTLSKELDKEYDVYYRVHVQNQGTTKWYKTGDIAGTTGKALRIEAIQVALVKKPANLPTEFK